ncbi:hypothetical protein VHA_002829 [Grimontia hollisae CIP 101886]|uniref:Uncharacterized protein n=1 Tax=Grimontia hollisae CIP 101886 TaxID=675812 RepID=D0IAQ2_GRIHO|nr:hypothetical protein VHA_002829 [Grimontia hollisae CIP 101886]
MWLNGSIFRRFMPKQPECEHLQVVLTKKKPASSLLAFVN